MLVASFPGGPSGLQGVQIAAWLQQRLQATYCYYLSQPCSSWAVLSEMHGFDTMGKSVVSGRGDSRARLLLLLSCFLLANLSVCSQNFSRGKATASKLQARRITPPGHLQLAGHNQFTTYYCLSILHQVPLNLPRSWEAALPFASYFKICARGRSSVTPATFLCVTCMLGYIDPILQI